MSVVYKTPQANFSKLSYSDLVNFGSSHLDLLDLIWFLQGVTHIIILPESEIKANQYYFPLLRLGFLGGFTDLYHFLNVKKFAYVSTVHSGLKISTFKSSQFTPSINSV